MRLGLPGSRSCGWRLWVRKVPVLGKRKEVGKTRQRTATARRLRMALGRRSPNDARLTLSSDLGNSTMLVRRGQAAKRRLHYPARRAALWVGIGGQRRVPTRQLRQQASSRSIIARSSPIRGHDPDKDGSRPRRRCRVQRRPAVRAHRHRQTRSICCPGVPGMCVKRADWRSSLLDPGASA